MSTVRQTGTRDTPAIGRTSLRDLFDAQRAAFDRGVADYDQRMAALRALEAALLGHQDAIVRATDEDFGGRARQETLLLELAPLVDGIRHARKHLANWMKPQRVAAGIHFFPAKARIVCQPLGVVGILGPWNYPTLLTLWPLVDALAAGNHAMLKPSELAPRTAEALQQMIAGILPAALRSHPVHGLNTRRETGDESRSREPDARDAGAGWKMPGHHPSRFSV